MLRVRERDRACTGASGYSLPPFIIFGNCFPSGPCGRNGPNNASYGISLNGYVDSNMFPKY